MTYNDPEEALRVMGLGERATLKDIKARHKELVKRYHTDVGSVAARVLLHLVGAERTGELDPM